MLVAVASGKGGTGKTTIAVNLALALAEKIPVQVLDCDVEEPNAHLFLQPVFQQEEPVTLPVPEVDNARCDGCGRCSEACAFHALAVAGGRVITFPEMCHGCGACISACPHGALAEKPHRIGVVARGRAGRIDFVQGKIDVGVPLAPPVIRAVKKQARGEGLTLLDAPPGTSCPVVAAVKDCNFCLLVTEPTPFGLNDLRLAVGMVRELGIPFAVVINRSTLGDLRVERYCRHEGIPVLLKIPFNKRYAATYAQGKCLVQEYPDWAPAFAGLWREIERLVAQHAGIAGN
ncbi:ATP-binding protein [Neomoorella thermoacetica]|uniref:ATP-binding protein n=1 Tax=Neomoorella thermoacetica TaxID=1525 RepID=UPI0008F9FA80|nr:ATP-binding protein [Moorella thermoacetica]OIQ11437.1 anaerobic sulfite reductase subunit C [Moorella thermoacetica]